MCRVHHRTRGRCYNTMSVFEDGVHPFGGQEIRTRERFVWKIRKEDETRSIIFDASQQHSNAG